MMYYASWICKNFLGDVGHGVSKLKCTRHRQELSYRESKSIGKGLGNSVERDVRSFNQCALQR